jgi:hypothetical protein
LIALVLLFCLQARPIQHREKKTLQRPGLHFTSLNWTYFFRWEENVALFD